MTITVTTQATISPVLTGSLVEYRGAVAAYCGRRFWVTDNFCCASCDDAHDAGEAVQRVRLDDREVELRHVRRSSVIVVR